MKNAHSHLEWFSKVFWPEVEERYRLEFHTFLKHIPPTPGTKILDVGCGFGACSYVLKCLGYEVFATDAETYQSHERLIKDMGIRFFTSNLNEDSPFSKVEQEQFDGVVFCEVFEHLLNHPAGILENLYRILKPNGLMVFSTPNPNNLMDIYRVLTNKRSLWGTQALMEEKKISNGKVICRGDIHYREYTTNEIRNVLRKTGFDVLSCQFLPQGPSPLQSLPKRLAKKFLRPAFGYRLLGSTQFWIARRA